MAWEGGGTLSSRLHPDGNNNRIAWTARTPERLRLLERICVGVNALHLLEPRSIVHGDIKSENVLLAADGEPRLSDFGLASLREARSGSSTSRAASKENVAGTYHYKAPEMYGTRTKPALRADWRTDVYALATLCWEVLSGLRPWADFEEAERVIELRSGGSLDWSQVPRDVPLTLRALLARGVAVNRDERPSARELRDGLRAAIAEIQAGKFDVFLSHSWDRPAPNDPRGAAARDDHAPETKVVHSELSDDGLRVWVDKDQMGHDLVASMKEGVAASTVVVALISKKYAGSWPCQVEFAEAVKLGKPLVACIVEPDDLLSKPPARWLFDQRRGAASSHEQKIFETIKKDNVVFLGRVTALPWGQDGVLSEEQKAELLRPEAIPRLLRCVNEYMKRKEEEG
jgi:serine/threonine protein kinase